MERGFRVMTASYLRSVCISGFFYVSPANKVSIAGKLRPKSKFLGNSVSTMIEGENRMALMSRLEDGGASPNSHTPHTPEAGYVIAMSNMYARGLLFGKMAPELGDTCMARRTYTPISSPRPRVSSRGLRRPSPGA